jgi:hypothetical protein
MDFLKNWLLFLLFVMFCHLPWLLIALTLPLLLMKIKKGNWGIFSFKSSSRYTRNTKNSYLKKLKLRLLTNRGNSKFNNNNKKNNNNNNNSYNNNRIFSNHKVWELMKTKENLQKILLFRAKMLDRRKDKQLMAKKLIRLDLKL